ncbi:uncharacterized protein B0H18DRAFT_978970 [Fomitopsis serialis]|uniref:uncharacterized protein n=1 Tax=Fomitopsis serialis TaxID=139415 RepID=UPI00200888A3|nr:uncharacterized protein B0H18DRAFT_978970 [Neoantrodia serialis]KAH9934922.1 hypothetical protein B0H18DRAFT_978970 [Neoantrodia serialis]
MFHIANGVFTALRAYAISNRSVPLAVAICLFSLVEAAIDVYEICSLTEVSVPQPVGCEITSGGNPAIDRSLYPAGQASTVIPEVLLLAATWRYVYTAKLANDVQTDIPLAKLFLRDGTMYFVAIFLLMTINIVLDATTVSVTRASSVHTPTPNLTRPVRVSSET